MKLCATLKARNVLIVALMLTFTMIVASESLFSQQTNRPLTPKLSLVGGDGTFNNRFYPDGRIWVPTQEGEQREFLVPVFIDNRWYSYYYQSPNEFSRYIANPINSFKFSLFYNEKAVRYVGVETVAPEYLRRIMGGASPLAEDWYVSGQDQKDNWYLHFVNPNQWASKIDDSDGRRVTITGASSLPLANTDNSFPDNSSLTGVRRDGQENYEVLLFVRFKVIYDRPIGSPADQSQRSIIYIDNRDITYNNTNIYEKSMINEMADYDMNLGSVRIATDYPAPPSIEFFRDYSEEGLGGVTYIRTDEGDIRVLSNFSQLEPIEPYRKGSIALNIGDFIPDFEFSVDGSDGGNEAEQNIRTLDGEEWYFTQPFTVDTRSTNPPSAISRLIIRATPSGSRLSFIEVESDSRWLQFRTVASQQWPNQIDNFTRLGFIEYIDNETVGGSFPVGKVNILAQPITLAQARPQEVFEIQANPNIGQDVFIENGIYTGYVTFKSPYARINPTRIKVTFIHLRNPLEITNDPLRPGGIHLIVRNSAGQTGQATQLVFGTGDRATNGVDSLYGEFAHNSLPAANQFFARFFPPVDLDLTGHPEEQNLRMYGFGDFAPNALQARTSSRDIRKSGKLGESMLFRVVVNAAGALNYPIRVQWSTASFPAGAQLFIWEDRDGTRGNAVNMREATIVQGAIREYTITDASVNTFFIEYTPVDVIEYVDEKGDPIIKRGWNLLSTPVRPANAAASVVYPRAINDPIKYTNNNWQPENVLKTGVGYFVKYSNEVDTRFSGSKIYEISNDRAPFDPVWVYGGEATGSPDVEKGGWNTVGALSVPTGINNIRFTAYSNQPVPEVGYTRRHHVWGYSTGKGYFQVSQLMPGLGYWIKVNSDGFYALDAPPLSKTTEITATDDWFNEIAQSSRKLQFSDNQQSNYSLYVTGNTQLNASQFELPPVPPVGLFDVRFDDNRYLTNANEDIIHLQGVAYPLSIYMENADADYVISDAITGTVYGTLTKGASSNLVIDNTPFNMLKLTRLNAGNDVFEVDVYPNPVNQFSTVNVELPEAGYVRVQLFDALGNIVANIAEGDRAAGSFTERIDVSNLAVGNYFVRVSYDRYSYSVKLSVIK